MTGIHSDIIRSEILDWRDGERLKVVDHLAQQLPTLKEQIERAVNKMGVSDWVWRSSFHDEKIAPFVEEWMQSHYLTLQKSYADSVRTLETQLAKDTTDHSWSVGEIANAGVTAVASVAPLAVIPAVAGFATVTTTTLFVFTTSAISLPALALAATGLAAVTFGSSEFRNRQINNLYQQQVERVQLEARRKIIGDPDNPDEPSMQRQLLAEIDQIALYKMENLT